MIVLCCWFLLILIVCLFIILKRTHPILFLACIAFVSLILSLLIRIYRNVVLGALVILIYVGGVIVPFSYRVCLAPNPDFVGVTKSSGLIFFFSTFVIFLVFLLFYFLRFYVFFSQRTIFIDFSLRKVFQYDSSIFFSDGWGKIILELRGLLVVLLVSVVSFRGCSKGALVPANLNY